MKKMQIYNPTGKKYGIYSNNNNSVDEVFDTVAEAQDRIEELKPLLDAPDVLEVVELVP